MKKRTVSLLLTLVLTISVSVFFGCKTKESAKISAYEINVNLKEDLVEGKMNFDFYNSTDNSFKELKFNLHANAFRSGAKNPPISAGKHNQAYYAGESYGYFKVLSVKDKDGDLKYRIAGEDQNVLAVELRSEIFPNEKTTVEVEYQIKLAKVTARTGITPKTINLANFYPILCGLQDGSFYECVYYSNGDPYFSDVANYQVKFSYPSDYVVAHAGEIKQSFTENGITTSVYAIEKARSFCLVLSKDFDILTENVEGVSVNYYFYDDANAKAMLTTAVESIKYFNKTFGKYPYKTYSVCKTPFMEGGMEFPSITYISDDLEERAFKEVIIHETAHQWWQTGVGNNEIEYGFLDEGLAEYSVVLFYENHPEYGFTRENLIMSSEKTYKTFCSVYDKLFGSVNTVMIRSLKDFNSEYEYVNVAYVKPTIMYDYLRKTLGDDKFFSALRRYYEEYCFLNATPDDLISVFEKERCDSEGYFLSFFEGKVIL